MSKELKLSEKIENMRCDAHKNELQDIFEEAKGLEARIEELEELVKAVAHIGVDFGYGEFKLNDKHIEKAREIMKGKAD